MSLGDVAIEVGRELPEGLGVRAYQDVAVTEAVRLGLLVELHAKRHILNGNVALAPVEQNHAVDEERQQEVDQHAANHDEQSLPGGLGAKLPRLCRFLHLLRVEALVNHARYLAVAAQRNPADAVLRVAALGLELEQAELVVKEDIELLHPDAKELGEEEVASLVEEYQQRQRQYKL